MIDAILFWLQDWSQVDAAGFVGKLRSLMLVSVSVYLRFRYALVRLRLRIVRRFRKLRVVFVIGDDCKWKCQTVYDAMMMSDDFDPFVAPTMMDLGWIDDSLQPGRVKRCREFLLRRGCRIVDAVDMTTMAAYPFSKFKADIVIYQQPWGMPRCQSPIAVSRYALTFYSPYFITSIGSPWLEFLSPFQKQLYVSLMENEEWKRYYMSIASRFRIGAKLIACGCPMREEIAEYKGGEPENAVIFAPHWSFPHELNSGSSNDSTFLWSGKAMLEYARAHREIHWIFKPHPMLKVKLIQCEVMSKAEVEDYWQAWRELGEVGENGDYIPLFYKSRAMVTDCMSFQSEYLIVNRPLVHLRSDKASEPLPPGRKLGTAFYDVWNEADLIKILDVVIEQRQDPMLEKRTRVRRELGYDDNRVSARMQAIIRNEI